MPIPKPGPGTILITGISASGKSELGVRLLQQLRENSYADVEILEGEDIRRRLERSGRKYGYSAEERNLLAMDLAEMAQQINSRGRICIICAICHVRDTRRRMRRILGNLMEVHLDCPVEVCAKRDPKGHYRKAFAGLYESFIGVTEPYELSDNPELTLNTGTLSVEKCSAILYEATVKFLRNYVRQA